MTGWGQSGPLSRPRATISTTFRCPARWLPWATRRAAAASAEPRGRLRRRVAVPGVGMLAALLEVRQSGQGQVVDAAMCDGVASLMTQFYALSAMGQWTTHRKDNLLDGGAPFYGTYACSDGKFVSVGPIEPQFYALLREKLGPVRPGLRSPERQAGLAADAREACAGSRDAHARRMVCATRGHGCLRRADPHHGRGAQHPHLAARETFVTHEGIVQPAPAPRFSRTPSAIQAGTAPLCARPPRSSRHGRRPAEASLSGYPAQVTASSRPARVVRNPLAGWAASS